jgi:predicted nucleotidyltransferase
MIPPIPIDRATIHEFCQQRHIRRLALFGSVLRPDFSPASDVDVLVEFEPSHTPGLDFFGYQDELSQMLGRPVDLNTPACFRSPLRERIEASSETVYATEN